jgi:hypothetical protein
MKHPKPTYRPGPCKECGSKGKTKTVIWAGGRGITRLCVPCIDKWKNIKKKEVVAVYATSPMGNYPKP